MNIYIAGAIGAYNCREEIALSERMLDYYKKRGHRVDSIMLPYLPDLRALPEQLLGYRLLTLDQGIDLLITVGYPAFALQHSNKNAFLFGLAPQFHEYWDSKYGIIIQPDRQKKDLSLRSTVIAAETVCLTEAKHVFCGSAAAKADVEKLGVKADVFRYAAPYELAETEINADEMPTIVCETNLEAWDRTGLVLEAISLASQKRRLQLYIIDADDMYVKAIKERISRLNISDKVEVHVGCVPKAALQSCAAFINMGIEVRKIPSSLQQAECVGVPCILAKDGGALLEIGGKRNIVEPIAEDVAAAFDELTSLHKPRDGQKGKTEEDQRLDAILERLVK